MMSSEHQVGLAGRLARGFLHSKLTPLIVVASIALGVAAVLLTPREEEPQITVPVVDVLVPLPGATAREVGKVVKGKREKVVAFTDYGYDALGRLVLMRMFRADETRQELVRTEYRYEAAELEPRRTTVTTVPDNTVRVVE